MDVFHVVLERLVTEEVLGADLALYLAVRVDNQMFL